MNTGERIIHPGPIDPSVLTLQNEHRSSHIWNGHAFEALNCRRADSCFKTIEARCDHRVMPYLISSGFYGVYCIGKIKYDWSLITALMERWREETHSFHLRIGEATITLQDVGVLLGLPIEGHVVTSSDPKREMFEWQDLCEELLGRRPPQNMIVGVSLKLIWLMGGLEELPLNATLERVQQHVRSIILALIGGVVLPNKSGNKVDLKYLSLLRDIEMIGAFSWGSAALACLYHGLCRATKPNTKQIGGCLLLLQIWAWERFCCMRPNIERSVQSLPILDPRPPLGYKLDELPDYCLRGMPELWMSKVPLICFEKVEFIFPDRVLRQFGMLQGIPVPCDTIRDLHIIDRRGKNHIDWADEHKYYIHLWVNYEQFVVNGDIGVEHMGYNHEYMMWYRQITRMFVGNSYPIPAQIDEGDEGAHLGYRGIGSGVEGLLQQLQRIDFLLGQVDQPCLEVTESRSIIADTFTAYREHDRLEAEQLELPPMHYTAPHTQKPKERRRRCRGQVSSPPGHSTGQVSSPPANPTAPSSSQASPSRTQRERIQPTWLPGVEFSTPNQFGCVTQVDVTSRSQVEYPSRRWRGPVYSRRERRPPNRYTPN